MNTKLHQKHREGELIEYTGKSKVLYGETAYEYRYVTGIKKGAKRFFTYEKFNDETRWMKAI